MGTRAAAFTAKIHNLQHYNTRIQNGVLPLPSGDDVANTLKYFSQTLLCVLKDVPTISLDMLKSPEKDHARTSLFPSLDYKGLYLALVELVDAVPLVQHGAHTLGHTILHTFACLVPFLEHEYMDTLPFLIASTMTLFPCSLHKDIIDMLCKHLLPFTLTQNAEPEQYTYASTSTPAVLMMIFQYTDCSAFHCQVLECLMSLKKDIVKDLLCVVAHGTAKARCHAVELLFQYLPTLNPALLDRKGIGNKLNGWLLDSLCTLTCLVLFPTFSPSSVSPSLMPPGSSHTGWKPIQCQRENCLSVASNEAIKMCFDHSVAIGSCEQPPPVFICEACAEDIVQEHGSQHMADVLLPMDKVSVTCENADCKSADKSAVATCFSPECADLNSHRPIRYCAQCVILYHNSEHGMDHMIHTTVPSPWNMDHETQSYMVEAIISLLQEAEPVNDKQVAEPAGSQEDINDSAEVTVLEERQLLSRYGIWLLVGLCTPNETTPVESLGRLLSMLFQWFHYTACLPDDQAGNALERLKAEYIHGWLMEVVKTHFEVFVSCLLPHPVDYAKVGGHWESWPAYTTQIKEGFKRLLCLVPYDIITLEVWEYIMPHWMEAFQHEILESEFGELKILLSKVLDPDLSPLGFATKQMYKFLHNRFESNNPEIQEQALSWLQILTMLEVPVPLDLLFEMFSAGVKSLNYEERDSPEIRLIVHPPNNQLIPSSVANSSRLYGVLPNLLQFTSGGDDKESQDARDKSGTEFNLPCYILMLDVFIKQMELQEIPAHKGLEQSDSQNIMLLLRDILKVPWYGIHTCCEQIENDQCIFCEICAIWFQLCLVIIEYFSPVMEVTMADVPSGLISTQMSYDDAYVSREKAEHAKEAKPETDAQSISPVHKEEHVVVRAAEDIAVEVDENEASRDVSPILTATVQECAPELDTVAIIPTENVVTAIAREVTLTDDDVASAKCTVASAVLLDENDREVSQAVEDPTFWHTSEGKFKFAIEELPPQLQLFYVLLKNLANYEDADVLYHILSCLKVMCLHSEILNKAAHTHRGFLIWCQENLLITDLWKLLQTEFSHIAQLATSLLLHCVTLPCGSDMFWKILERDFHNETWRSRYAAVEKITVIAHFVESAVVKNSPLLQSALANAFCYLVHCMDDIQPTISQRALLNLETIKTSSLKLLLWCLEMQFDCNIIDRPMILQTVSQMHNHLSNRRFLTWDFFMNRFDTLFLEAQVILERTGDVTYVRDLKNTNTNSEMFQRKLKRAHDALSLLSSSRSLSASFGVKWPYQRAMSAPGGMISRQDKLLDKDKLYERQSSAPVLKRKSSRFIGSAVTSLGPLQHFPNSFFTDGHLKETIQEETHFLNVLHRAMEMDEHDKDTLHLLIFLLMQFLSRPDSSQRTDDKVTRSQHIVLRHLNILLGYSQNTNEGRFLIPPSRVRGSAVFSSFLMSMPKVLDYNFNMGNGLLNTCLSLLVCCPSPQKYPNDHYPPTYSLWLLEPYCRHSWLVSVLVIMYKYHYDSHPYSRQIHWLIAIVLNTLKAQFHECKHSADSLLSPLPSRSRDFSTPSADIENIHDREKEASFETNSFQDDIIKPFIGSGIKLKGFSAQYNAADRSDDIILGQIQKGKDKGERHQWKSWKTAERSCSSEGEDIEPELEAIPESPKSESSEPEQFIPNLSGVSQTLEQACVKLVNESYAANEEVVVTDPWSRASVTDDTALIMNSETVKNTDNTEYKSVETVLPSNNHSSSVIEKSAVETMEKHINSSCGSDDVLNKNNNINSECMPQIPYSENNERAVLSYLKNQDSTESNQCTQSLKLQADILPEKDINISEQYQYQKESCDLTLKSNESNSTVGYLKSFNTFKPYETSFGASEQSNEKYSLNIPHDSTSKSVQSETVQDESLIHSSLEQKDSIDCLTVPKADCDNKQLNTKYPRSKLFSCKRKDQQKGSRKSNVLASENVATPLFRPPLERLLPIGLPDKERQKKIDSPNVPCTNPFFSPSDSQHMTFSFDSSFTLNRELGEDKAVQAGGGGLPFDLPAPERLLPVGPLPSRKDWFTTSIFKTSFGEFSEDDKSLYLDQSVDSNSKFVESSYLEKAISNLPASDKRLSEHNFDFGRKHEETGEVYFEKSDTLQNYKTLQEHKPLAAESDEKWESLSQKSDEIFSEKNKDTSNYSEKNLEKNLPEHFKNSESYGDVPKANTEEYNLFKIELKDLQEKAITNLGEQRSCSMEALPTEKSEVVNFLAEYESFKQGEKVDDEVKCRHPYRQRKQKKPGLNTLEAQKSFDYQNTTTARRGKKSEFCSMGSAWASKRSSTSHSFNARCGDDVVLDRCTECGVVLEEYSDEELGLCIVILATFVHREPTMAAPVLPKMLRTVAKVASNPSYPWQSECNVHLPGGAISVARQFLRCTLHQLAPNGIFVQIFVSHCFDAEFFKTMAAALADFTEINQVTPLLLLFENLNEKKHLHLEIIFHILDNVAAYLDCLPVESSLPPWNSFLQQLETFLRKFLFLLPAGPCQLNSVLNIMLAAIKMPVINSAKSIMDPFSKILSHAIQHSVLDYQQLSGLCHHCYRNMSRERDKLLLTRTAVFELVQALKFKTSIPDANLLLLVQFILEDCDGSLGPNIIIEGLPDNMETNMFSTSANECMRQYLNDALEFVADVHTLNKVKNMPYGNSTHLNEETLGGHLKAGIAQYLAIEISKGNGRDNRAIGRYLPWLYHPPTILQQGPKEFIDCVSHIRLLSWLLLGSLIHGSLLQNSAAFVCQPIPLEANSHIAEHIQVVLAGFAEQSKVSVLHMSSLFHAFILCQLWTMYCEHMVSLNPPGSEQSQVCVLTLTDFWAKVTPGILQLVCHSKVLAEMVSLHFLSLMEALMECNSTVLARLLPMWTPVLYSFQGQLPGNLHVRLHSCVNFQPPIHAKDDVSSLNTMFLRWLQRLQFKMGQIELQSSAATQFYSL